MLFLFIYVYWCPIPFPYDIMFVSLSNKMGATSGAGIVYLSFPEHMGSSLFFMGFV